MTSFLDTTFCIYQFDIDEYDFPINKQTLFTDSSVGLDTSPSPCPYDVSIVLLSLLLALMVNHTHICESYMPIFYETQNNLYVCIFIQKNKVCVSLLLFDSIFER